MRRGIPVFTATAHGGISPGRCVVAAGDYSHDQFEHEEVQAAGVAQSS